MPLGQTVEMTPEILVAEGVHDPAAPNAAERQALIDHLLARGFTPEAIVERFRQSGGGIISMAATAAWSKPPQPTSARAVAETCGVAVERVVLVQRALGFEITDLDAPDLWDWLVDDIRLFELGASLFGEEAALSFLRVIGASTVRIAEAAASLFGVSFQGAGRYPTELELSQAAELSVGLLEPLTAMMAHAIDAHMFLKYRSIPAVIDGKLELAVGFVDLVGSTSWALGLPVPEYTRALALFEDAAWDLATRLGGRVVKLIGDAAMFVAPSTDAACAIATELCALVGSQDALPAARAAVGFGPVTARDGDFFGHLVHVVARATKEADPGHVVLTALAATRLQSSRWRVSSLGERQLRGVDQVVELFNVTDTRSAAQEPVRKPTV